MTKKQEQLTPVKSPTTRLGGMSEASTPVNPLTRVHPLCELPVKIRLEGLPADIETFARLLRETGCVIEESPDYPNRGVSKFARRYITVKL